MFFILDFQCEIFEYQHFQCNNINRKISYSKGIPPSVLEKIGSMDSSMCSNRSLSLISSLINQFFVMVSALNGKRKQGAVFHNIHRTVQNGFQVDNHGCMLQ